jgi:hypothetical protein
MRVTGACGLVLALFLTLLSLGATAEPDRIACTGILDRSGDANQRLAA